MKINTVIWYNILSVFMLFGIIIELNAQQTNSCFVSGNVLTTDGEPAEFISVSLKNTTYGALTDASGNFAFYAPPSDYTLMVYSIFAHKKELPVTIAADTKNHFADIEILENVNQLEDVVVTGQFTPQSLHNSLYKIRVVNQKAIAQKAPSDLQSLLNTEIGVRISNDMALGESDFELMGMSGNNVKVLIDGVPMVDRGSTKQSLSQIDVNTIEQVEIVEGPMSVIYGTDALAGVINIITKKAKTNSAKNSVSVSARIQEESMGSEYDFFHKKGIHNQSVNASFASKTGMYLDGSFARNTHGGWTGTGTGREKTWAPKDQFLYNATLGYKNSDWHVWYRFSYLDETIYNAINPTDLNPTQLSDRDYLTDRRMHNLQADWRPDNRLTVNVIGSLQNYKRRTKTVVTDTATGEKWLSSEESSQDVSKYDAQFVRATAAWTVSPTVSLQPGIEYNHDKGSGGRILGEPSISTLAAFLSAEWKPWEWINFRPGLRSILWSDYKAPWVIPSFLTRVSVNPNMDLRFSYAYGFRAPTLQELYFSFHNANHNIDGNPDLKAEYSNNFTLSYTWRILHNEHVRLTSTLSGFYNDFRDRITTAQSINDPTLTTYYNIDKYKTTGGSFENIVWWNNLQANVAFMVVGRYNSLSDNEQFVGDDLPEFRFSPELTTSISYQLPKWRTNVNLFYKFTGSRNEYRYDSNNGTYYLGGLASYNWADLTVSQPAGKYLIVNAGVKNLFNITTVDNTTRSSGHSGGGASLMGCGRSYFVGLAINFNK